MSNESAFAAINLQSSIIRLMAEMSNLNSLRRDKGLSALFTEGAFETLEASCGGLRTLTVDSLTAQTESESTPQPAGDDILATLTACADRLYERFPEDAFQVRVEGWAGLYRTNNEYAIYSCELNGTYRGQTLAEAEAKCTAAFEEKAKAVSEVIAAQEVVELAQVEEEHVSTVTGD